MKKLSLIIALAISFLKLNAQVSLDYLVPHFFVGKGIGEMNNVSSIVGIGYDIGYEIPNSPFGVYGFLNSGTYGRLKRELPISRPLNDTHILPIINKSNVTTYGLKVRYTPLKLKQPRFNPFIEIGFGSARHKSIWRSNGISLEGEDLYTSVDEDCPKNPFEEREMYMRNTALMSNTEIGFTYKLYSENQTAENPQISKDNGLYLTFSVRLEYGGNVIYNNVKNHPYRFFYDSGINNAQDRPLTHLAPPRSAPGAFDAGRHTMVMFQLSISKVIF